MKPFAIALLTSFLVSLLMCILIFTGVINLKKILPEDFFPQEKETVQILMPNFINLKISDAEKTADQLGLKIISEEITAENSQPDIVLSQFPLPGYKTCKGDAVKLTVSKAVESTIESISEDDLEEAILSDKVIMPDITGFDSETANDLLNKCGITNISEKFADNSRVEKGKIISFNPPAGSEIDPGAAVDIVISKGGGGKFVIVPNLYNKSLDEAKKEIEKSKMKLGKVNEVNDIDKGFNKIIGQSIQWGEKVKEGTVIDINLNAEAEESIGW